MARKQQRTSILDLNPVLVFLISFAFIYGMLQIIASVLIEISR